MRGPAPAILTVPSDHVGLRTKDVTGRPRLRSARLGLRLLLFVAMRAGPYLLPSFAEPLLARSSVSAEMRITR